MQMQVLILPHKTQGIIAQNHNFCRNMILPHGRKLHHGHLETAVSADSDNLPVRICQLRPHRGRQRVSHGSHAAAG